MIDFLLLADFSVIKPDPGLILWTSVVFILVWVILGRMAFRPIQNALKERENSIQGALDEAKLAKEEMANLKAKNEELLNEAREERANILKEAKEAKDNIIKEAKDKAKDEAKKIVMEAKVEIDNQKMASITEVKNQMGAMIVDVTEQLLRKELSSETAQEDYIKKLIEEAKPN